MASELYVLTADAHAVQRHGSDALRIVERYNQRGQCEVWESTLHNRLMYVFPMPPVDGLLFTTKGGVFITCFFVSPPRLAHIIARDGYVRMR